MASKIDMASNALLLLGDRPISSFEGAGAGAQAMANLYEPTYLDMITSSNWGFAKKQQVLSQNATPPVFDNYQYSYTIPNDAIRIHGLRSNMEYYTYEGDLIYTNDSGAELEFFIRPSEGDLPPYFVKLMELELAARSCMAVTDRVELYAQMRNEADNQWIRAVGVDAGNDTNEAIRSNPFIEVRG